MLSLIRKKIQKCKKFKLTFKYRKLVFWIKLEEIWKIKLRIKRLRLQFISKFCKDHPVNWIRYMNDIYNLDI